MATFERILIVLILTLFSVCHVFTLTCPPGDDVSVVAKLKSKLFCNYDRYTRPVSKQEHNVTIDVSLDLKYLNIDEFGSQMIIHSWIVTEWDDRSLKWNMAEYENISYLVIPSEDIWIPDLSVYNSDLTQVMLFSSTTCLLYSSGHIKCAPDLRTPVYCEQNLARWPYDVQNCSLYVGSWAHAGEEIDIKLNKGKGYRTYLYMKNNAWELLGVGAVKNNVVYCCPNSTFPHIVYYFNMKRHASMWAASVIAPAFVLAGITLISFWVRGIATRVCLCCTSLIGDALFIQYIGYHLPANGESSPNIVAFYRDAMFMTMVALIIALGVERLRDVESKIGGEAPGWLTGGASWLKGQGGRAGQLLLGDSESETHETPQDVESVAKAPQCSAFATLLDRLTFLALFIAYSILLMALLP